TAAPGAEIFWLIRPNPGGLTMAVTGKGDHLDQVTAVEIVFPFDPRVTPTTVLPREWAEDGHLTLPAVITAPDFGEMLLAEAAQRSLKARLEGSRANKTVDVVVEVPPLRDGKPCELHLTPVQLSPPKGLED